MLYHTYRTVLHGTVSIYGFLAFGGFAFKCVTARYNTPDTRLFLPSCSVLRCPSTVQHPSTKECPVYCVVLCRVILYKAYSTALYQSALQALCPAPCDSHPRSDCYGKRRSILLFWGGRRSILIGCNGRQHIPPGCRGRRGIQSRMAKGPTSRPKRGEAAKPTTWLSGACWLRRADPSFSWCR